MRLLGSLVFLLITFILLVSSQNVTLPRQETFRVTVKAMATAKSKANIVPLINVTDKIFFQSVIHIKYVLLTEFFFSYLDLS